MKSSTKVVRRAIHRSYTPTGHNTIYGQLYNITSSTPLIPSSIVSIGDASHVGHIQVGVPLAASSFHGHGYGIRSLSTQPTRPSSGTTPATARVAINDTCPWSGKPVESDSLTKYNNHIVGFCNTGCRDKFATAINHFDKCAAQQTSTYSTAPSPSSSRAPLPSPSSIPPVTPRRVVVTGIGLVTPLGVGTNHVWQRLTNGDIGVTSSPATISGLADLPSRVCAVVPRGPSSEHAFDAKEWVPRDLISVASPFIQYALGASEMALRDANWRPTTEEQRDRTGVCIGSGIGSVEDSAEAGIILQSKGHRRVGPYVIPRMLVNLAAGQVSIAHGLRGPNHAVSTACSTGAHAIGDAYRFIKYGSADVMLAGGSEATVAPLSMSLFAKIRALSTAYNDRASSASRPFDSDRDGFVMSEGSAVLVLEELSHAMARNATIYAEVSGYGLSADAHHVTQPAADGRGAILCMRAAMTEAGLQPHHIDYLNAHATSTPIGDAIEARAIQTVFGDHARAGSGNGLAVSSTKGSVGHMLGAAGAVEAAFTILALKHQTVPPNVNLQRVDDAAASLDLVRDRARSQVVRAAMSNSFGFGGTNTSLVFRQMA